MERTRPRVIMADIPSDILDQMERFCAYQERCVNDVRRKLTSFHLSDNQVNAIIESLKADGFLDEDRFVEAFVRSKVKSAWGKRKIVSALWAKRIPDALIQRHLDAVPEDSLREQLQKSIEKWLRTHPDALYNSNKRSRLIRHLVSKGYELDDILREL